MTNFSTPLPLYAPVHILDDPPPFPQLRTYLMHGLFLDQKNNSLRANPSKDIALDLRLMALL